MPLGWLSYLIVRLPLFQKLRSDAPKVPKQAETKKDGEINQQNYNYNQFYTDIWMLSKPYESTEVERRTLLRVSSGTHLSTSNDTHQVVET